MKRNSANQVRCPFGSCVTLVPRRGIGLSSHVRAAHGKTYKQALAMLTRGEEREDAPPTVFSSSNGSAANGAASATSTTIDLPYNSASLIEQLDKQIELHAGCLEKLRSARIGVMNAAMLLKESEPANTEA